MEAFKLVKMTDYVLNIEKRTTHPYEAIELTLNYANFLKTSLTLGMFIACDEDGNPLINWVECSGYVILYQNEIDIMNKMHKISEDDVFGFIKYEGSKYQEAKERVLFEGFSLYYSVLDESNMLKLKKHSKEELFNADALFRLYETIEDLTQYNLTLTQNAVNKFKI